MTALKDLFDLTEFSFVDPDAVHLVGRAANGVESPLLAKAADEVTGQLIKGLTDQFVENYCFNQECEVCKGRFLVLSEADPGFVEKAKLKAKDRKALPDSAFALPEKREYPIHDENHARAALSMLHNASPEDQKRIKAAVHRRYPNIEIDGDAEKMDVDAEKTVSTDESLSQTREVGGAPEAHDPSDGGGGEPRSVSFPHNAAGDGGGDTATDKDLHRAEAESQTPGAQTNKADDGEQPFVAVDNAAADAAEKDATSADGGSHEGAEHTHQPVSKEEIDMDHDELTKVLDERDERLAARVLDAIKADRKTRKAKKAKKAEKATAAAAGEGTETETAKGAEEASKAAEGEGAAETVEERLAKAEGLLAKMAGEDGKPVAVNGAGVVAMLRGTPEQRESVFKQLDERVEEAEKSGDLDRIRTARFQRTAAKMVAQENARERGEMPRSSRFGPNTTELFTRTGTLDVDTDIHGV